MSDVDTDSGVMSDVDTDSGIIELTQLTEPRCDHPQCSIVEKTKPTNLAHEKKAELRI